jgi:hypothetical protein
VNAVRGLFFFSLGQIIERRRESAKGNHHNKKRKRKSIMSYHFEYDFEVMKKSSLSGRRR